MIENRERQREQFSMVSSIEQIEAEGKDLFFWRAEQIRQAAALESVMLQLEAAITDRDKRNRQQIFANLIRRSMNLINIYIENEDRKRVVETTAAQDRRITKQEILKYIDELNIGMLTSKSSVRELLQEAMLYAGNFRG